MKIYISKKAKNDLFLYALYKNHFNPKSGYKFLNDFNSKIQILNLFPYMYSKINSNSNYRKILFNKKFLIIYLIKDNTIFIDSVINCKQKNTNNL